MKPHLVPLACLALALPACQADRPDPGTEQAVAIVEATADPAQLTYHPDLGINVAEMQRFPSGILYRDLELGTGDSLRTGDRAAVTYTGWLPDGTRFDTNVGADPYLYVVGAGEVIQGWDLGLLGMQPGGRRQLILPHEMGYGAQGSGPIPPFSVLVFEVELREILR